MAAPRKYPDAGASSGTDAAAGDDVAGVAVVRAPDGHQLLTAARAVLRSRAA